MFAPILSIMTDSDIGARGVPDRLAAALADRYRIERELGQGGMATVYLAEDLKHNRRVAIKVLKPELAAVVGAERFLAEIETTAQLQHPHVLPLFDSGEADSFLYYVMPHVDGETLRDRLERERQLPVDEAVTMAGKIASALAYAHENGVLHRDIKPANVLLSRGEPLVADFGIALALGSAGGGRLTETGLSLGTPYYMSPEQATGDQYVGPPSDIYALGCVLYEMLVGDPPHGGSTAQAVLGNIIAGDPVNPRKKRASIPPNVDAAIRKALERLPADRFARADDFAQALRDPGFRHGEAHSAAAGGGGSGIWKPLAIAASVVALGAMGWALSSGGGPSSGVRDIGLPYEAPLLAGRNSPAMAVAPDASFVLYDAPQGEGTQLWYRSLEGLEARPIRGTEGTLGAPMISPDGTRAAFYADNQVKVVDLASEEVTVAGSADIVQGGRWLDDGRLFFSTDDGRLLRWFDPEAGEVRRAEADYCLYPLPLDGSDRVLCSGGSWKFAFARDLADPLKHEPWTRSAGAGRPGASVRGVQFEIVDDEYLVYLALDGALTAAPIVDRAAGTVGRSVTLVRGIRRESYSGAGQWDLAEDGTLVYGLGINAETGRLVRISQEGDIATLNVDEAVHLRYRESPDGRRLATVVEVLEGQELRVYDLETGAYETVEERFFIGMPQWSPDGTQLVYNMNDEDGFDDTAIFMRRLNSTEPARPILRIPGGGGVQASTFLSADSLLVGVGNVEERSYLLDPTTDPAEVDTLPIRAGFLAISPDRRWITFQEPGTPGVYLQPWPDLDRRYTVVTDGAEPQWLSDGQLVYYAEAGSRTGARGAFAFDRVQISASSDPPHGEPVPMIRDPRFADTPGWSHAPSSDGRLIYLQGPEDNLVRYLRVVPGWVDEMKAAVDEANR